MLCRFPPSDDLSNGVAAAQLGPPSGRWRSSWPSAVRQASLTHTSQLHDALLALSAKEAQVQQSKEQADANYREARATIYRMLQQSEERVRGSAIPQVRELVVQQAMDALLFFRAIAAKNPEPDPALQFEIASALALVGRHRGLLGDHAQAAALLYEVEAIRQNLQLWLVHRTLDILS
jgi:hypothetical protein